MANTLITPTIIAQEAIMQLVNALVMASRVHRDFVNEFHEIGDSVRIRKPVKFTVNETADITNKLQDVLESYTTLTVDTQANVPWNFVSKDLTLTIEKYSERYITPAMIQIADNIDGKLTNLYKDVHRAVGTPGTTPNAFSDLTDAAAKLDQASVPSDSRSMVLEPLAAWSLSDSLKGLLLPGKVDPMLTRGYLGTLANFDILATQKIKTHTAGSWAVTGPVEVNVVSPATSDYDAEYHSLDTDGWGADRSTPVYEGEIITIADVYDVNPISRETLPHLKQFVVNADVSAANASGEATLVIEPAIIKDAASGGSSLSDKSAYDTVSALHANNADLTQVTNVTGPQNLGFHKNAFALVTVPLEIPDGTSWSARQSYNGLSVRVIKDYNILTDKEIIRLDVLYGTKTLYSDLAIRLMG